MSRKTNRERSERYRERQNGGPPPKQHYQPRQHYHPYQPHQPHQPYQKGQQGQDYRPRKLTYKDKRLFCRTPRRPNCLQIPGSKYVKVQKLFPDRIERQLAFNCETIEHQFIELRSLIQLGDEDLEQRYKFTQLFLECLERHHKARYEGILFGSTVNGLGFKDSDVDLRLRSLEKFGDDQFEALNLDEDMVEMTLRNIAYMTSGCCQAKSEFVPSVRCPVAKLKFITMMLPDDGSNCGAIPQEGLNYDISLSSKNTLGSYNSAFLKFLCQLRPKFHLLAIALRYWSKRQNLILPGYLSSYALINMLIHFCQTTQPPILPTVDEMRQIYLDNEARINGKTRDPKEAISQIEWHCLICLDPNLYPKCENQEPLSLLLLKFFEFYLKFPFSTHILSIRLPKALSQEEFSASGQHHPRFPIKKYVNIQDPFDLKHNLTSGLEGLHFRKVMATIRFSYEKLHKEIMNNFQRPFPMTTKNGNGMSSKDNERKRATLWGLNAIFEKISDQELKDA